MLKKWEKEGKIIGRKNNLTLDTEIFNYYNLVSFPIKGEAHPLECWGNSSRRCPFKE